MERRPQQDGRRGCRMGGWLALALGCALVGLGMRAAEADEPEDAAVGQVWGFPAPGGAAPLRPADLLAAGAGLAGLAVSSCEDCHVQEAREWRTSGHRQSWTRPLFQRAYRLEPRAECRNCHQPLTAELSGREAAALRQEGITCAVCHLRQGEVLAVRRSGRAPHPVREAPLLAGAAFCGGCHQFPFPEHRQDGRLAFTTEPMQDTLGEWRRSHRAGGAPCQSCHMPLAGQGQHRHRSHRFLGGYDAALLGGAVAVAAAALRPGPAGPQLALTLRETSGGHAVPTGDLFRSLVISAELVDGRGRGRGRAEPVVLTRRFVDVAEPLPGGGERLVRRQAQDSRLQPGEQREVLLQLPARRAAAVRYEVRLHRLPPLAAAAQDEVSLVTAGVVPLAAMDPGHPGPLSKEESR